MPVKFFSVFGQIQEEDLGTVYENKARYNSSIIAGYTANKDFCCLCKYDLLKAGGLSI